MNFTATAKTTAECSNFLHIIYEGQNYKIEDFSSKYKNGQDFVLDQKLKQCNIEYRGQVMTYEEMGQSNFTFSESLPFFTRYHDEIYPHEHLIMIGNYNYYKSAKFLSKAEKCLQTARYYLMNSKNILSTDFDINWSSGYGPQFLIRTIDFTTAVTWYNNCFDYILQIIYLAFELYKKVPKYNNAWTFEEILKMCSYLTVKKIYIANMAVNNLAALWNVIEVCHIALTDVNTWANYIKHKGGINFDGLTPDEPFHATMTDKDGNVIAESGDFDAIMLDLDQSISKLQLAHNALFNCLDQIVTFIDFNAAIPLPDSKTKNLLIPDKNKYVKIILP